DNLFPSRFLPREEALRRMPALRADGLHGAVSYSDGQFDDSRYDLSLVQTFTEAGGEAIGGDGAGFSFGRGICDTGTKLCERHRAGIGCRAVDGFTDCRPSIAP